ncbi:hypothetical protein BJX63DRAFT_347166 [Aspergillus granulosus]|uniref:Uncharacterized protein n=1 Tax=Aspergillus granulosus TaxID=176169 RepID=A0ABR4H306_9EURO
MFSLIDTENRSDDHWINIIGQDRHTLRIKSDVLLEIAVFMVKMIRAFRARQNSRRLQIRCGESDSNADSDFQAGAAAWTQGCNASNTFMSADLNGADLCNSGPIRSRSSAVLCVERMLAVSSRGRNWIALHDLDGTAEFGQEPLSGLRGFQS